MVVKIYIPLRKVKDNGMIVGIIKGKIRQKEAELRLRKYFKQGRNIDISDGTDNVEMRQSAGGSYTVVAKYVLPKRESLVAMSRRSGTSISMSWF